MVVAARPLLCAAGADVLAPGVLAPLPLVLAGADQLDPVVLLLVVAHVLDPVVLVPTPLLALVASALRGTRGDE